MRAARKRRSKLGSRRAASALSSGAMAGRGHGVARETGRQRGGARMASGGAEAVRGVGGGARCRWACERRGQDWLGAGPEAWGRSQGFGAKRGQEATALW